MEKRKNWFSKRLPDQTSQQSGGALPKATDNEVSFSRKEVWSHCYAVGNIQPKNIGFRQSGPTKSNFEN